MNLEETTLMFYHMSMGGGGWEYRNRPMNNVWQIGQVIVINLELEH